VRGGTTKLLTLFHPASGKVRVKAVSQSTNAILHPWIQEQVTQILASLPEPALPTDKSVWERWQVGLQKTFTLLENPPPLRMLLLWDNLTGHWSADLLVWLMRQGVMVLFTPVAGSWLNLCESMQRILVRRGLSGQSFESGEAIGASLEAVASVWNANPTPFEWGGKRSERRKRARDKHRLGGSGGFTRRPIRRRWK